MTDLLLCAIVVERMEEYDAVVVARTMSVTTVKGAIGNGARGSTNRS